MSVNSGSWLLWAIASAIFVALTAILAKIGVANVNSDFATSIRTIVILVVVALLLGITGQWQPPGTVSPRSYLFLCLSDIATGLSWLCYFRALQLGPASAVAPVDKLSVVLVAVIGVFFLNEKKMSASGWLGIALIGAEGRSLGFTRVNKSTLKPKVDAADMGGRSIISVAACDPYRSLAASCPDAQSGREAKMKLGAPAERNKSL